MLPCGLITRPVVQSISSLLWPSSFVARLYAPVIPITLLAASADPPRVLLISPRCLITRLAALVTFPYYLKSSLPIRSLFLVSTASLSVAQSVFAAVTLSPDSFFVLRWKSRRERQACKYKQLF